MTEWQGRNLLCFGDNLEFLTDAGLFPDECVDLIYLDPPFNSQQSYNVLFKETTGTPAAAQIKAFEDTWTWDQAANEALTRIHQDASVPAPLVELMKTFMNFLRPSPMMAYLVQMAIRLVHMHRVLKQTGSLYLHCDPTASHYLKLVLDAVFGPKQYANEISWKRSSAHSDTKQGMARYGRIRDVILYYHKAKDWKFNPQFTPYSSNYVDTFYNNVDEDGRRFTTSDLTAARPGGDTSYEWRGVRPYKGRYWAYSKENMEEFERQGRLVYTKSGAPRYKRYLDEMPGVPLQDNWDDISPVGGGAQGMGYPTQKPLELLKRIVSASSNPGDVVLDPFCGCGTTIDAVETINRENPGERARTWIGIDVTHLSINLIKHRLTRFVPPPEYEVIGEPASPSGAAALAQHDAFQFQFWALGLIGARPTGGRRKKGADKGIDGVRYFQDEQRKGAWVTKRMLVQVKSGKAGARDIRDFVGTMTRESAEMGVFVTLQPPTKPMRTEAATAGTYSSPWDGQAYPKVQILTIEELLADPQRPNPRCLRIPGGTAQHTLPEAPKHTQKQDKQAKLWENKP